jgi:RHS repeat-associated protein
LYTPPSGQQWLTTSRSYDFYGNSLQFVDARGNSTYYGYSATYGSAYLTNQTQVVGTTKITSLYTYDSNYGTMLSFKDPKGNTTSYQYDQLGRTTQVSYSTGNSNMVANPGFETADFAGWIQTGMIIRANQYHSGQFSAAPTYNGNYPAFTLQEKLPAVSGNSIASIHFWYLYGDPSVDTAQVLYSDGTSTQTTINTVGSWTLETLSFSTAKQIVGVKVTRSATSGENVYLDDFSITTKNDFTSYAYNDAGNYVDITNENGEQTRQIYDGLGRLSIVERFSGGAPYSNQTTSYNWMNLVIKQTDPLGNSTLFQYDALSRPTSVTGPDGNVTTTSYNELSSWVLSTDQYGNHGCKVYDRLGRLVSVVEYSDSNCNPLTLSGYSYVTNYSYDEVGNLLLATTANAQSTGYVYDNLNRLLQTTFADGTIEAYGYDRSGNIVKKVSRNSMKTLFAYDALNRLSTITYCGSPVTSQSYTYDKDSNVLTLQNQNTTLSYNYDARNRPLNETHAVNPSTRQVVDLGCSGSGGTSTVTGGASNTYILSSTYNGETTNTVIYPGVSVQYMYDGLGRPLAAQQLGPFIDLARLSYYKNDQVKGIQYGNGLVGNYSYDRLGRTSTIKLTNSTNGATMMLLNYAYNKTGTVASLTGQVNLVPVNEQYRYDPLQRLTNSTVTSGGGTTTVWYQYDNTGNRLVQSLNGTKTTYTYNTQNNELTGSSAPGTSTSYSYDSNGNLATKSVTTGGTVTWSYSWDANNHLVKVTNSTGQAQYAYDSKGRDMESVESGSTWFYAYHGPSILYKNLMNSNKYAYVSISGLLVSMVIDGTSQYYFHTDALGSVRMMTYQNTGLAYTNNYQPFGQDNGRQTGSFASRAVDKFNGERSDLATGLYYYYQRWYDPSIGRFISPDPKPCPLSECQKLNRYVYVTNRPTTLTDPDGLGTIMCQTSDGMISACGILRDSSGNLPPGTRILGSGAQPTVSSTSPGTTTMPDSSTEVTAPTGILRDNFGNLPAGTRITVVRTPTGSVVMGTTTVGAINQQIDEDRAKLGTPTVVPGSQEGSQDPYGKPMLFTGQPCPLHPPQSVLEALAREEILTGAVLLWGVLVLEGYVVVQTGGIGLIALAVPMIATFGAAVFTTDIALCSEGLTR